MSDNGRNLPEKRDEPVVLEPANAGGEMWERLKGESRQAFGNFAYFRDLGRERSLVKAADGVTRAVDTLKKQSVKYHWQMRVAAYDDYLDARDREILESERARVNKDGMAIFRRMQLMVGQRLLGDASDPRRPIAAINVNDLEMSDIVRMTDLFWRGQRTATGQPTDYVAGKFGISGDDLVRIIQGLYDIAERLLPEERRGRLAVEFQSFLERGPG